MAGAPGQLLASAYWRVSCSCFPGAGAAWAVVEGEASAGEASAVEGGPVELAPALPRRHDHTSAHMYTSIRTYAPVHMQIGRHRSTWRWEAQTCFVSLGFRNHLRRRVRNAVGFPALAG